MILSDWLAETTDSLVTEAANSGSMLVIQATKDEWAVTLRRDNGYPIFECGDNLHDVLAMVNHRAVTER